MVAFNVALVILSFSVAVLAVGVGKIIDGSAVEVVRGGVVIGDKVVAFGSDVVRVV